MKSSEQCRGSTDCGQESDLSFCQTGRKDAHVVRRLSGCLSFAQPPDFARFIRFSFGGIIRFCAFSGKRALFAVEFDISAEKSAFFRSENAVSAKKEVLGSVGGVEARASHRHNHMHINKIVVAANLGFPFGTPVANMGGDARTAGFTDE